MKKELEQKNSKDSIISINLDNDFKNSIGENPQEGILNIYADSINQATSVSSLPAFLKNSDFDDSNMALTLNTNEDGQFRSRILNRVTNCSALQLIISESSGIFRKRATKEKFSHTYLDSTNYELSKARLNILGCK